ncbi:MAG: DUF805 domain-containing protein, partial [Pseudomonadota bacterium]
MAGQGQGSRAAMGPIRSIIHVMAHPFRFGGRASFAEFWWFTGLTVILPWGAFQALSSRSILDLGPSDPEAVLTEAVELLATAISAPALIGGTLAMVLGAVLLSLWHSVAWFAVSVRRIHDTGRSAVIYVAFYLLPPAFGFYVGFNLAYAALVGDPAVVRTVMEQLAPFMILMIPAMVLYGLVTLWYLIVMLFPGDPTPNRFGPKPGGDSARARAPAPSVIPGAAPEPGAGLTAEDL